MSKLAKMNITDQPQALILLAYNAQLLKKEGIINIVGYSHTLSL